MFKLDLEKAEEPEIKLPTSAGSWKKQESSRKTSEFNKKKKKDPLLFGSDGKESACNAGDLGSIPRSGNGYNLTPVFLSGESHGQGSLADCKESDTTE